MRKPVIEDNNGFGRDFLDVQVLGKRVSRNTTAIYVAVAVMVTAAVVDVIPREEKKPLLLSTETGTVLTTYSTALEQRTVEERMQLAVLLYKGVRQRTGIKDVDGRALEDWRGQITKNGIAAWSELGERWANPHIVVPGFRRTVTVVSVFPDQANPYAFTIAAVESEGKTDAATGAGQYEVRLTLYFTDPKEHGTSRMDSVVLHSEARIK